MLRNHLILFLIFLCSFVCTACTPANNEPNVTPDTPPQVPQNPDDNINKNPDDTTPFATNDGRFTALNNNGNKALSTVLEKVNIERIKIKEPLVITDAEFAEIKEFTTKEIVKDAEGIEAFKRIFRWVTSNVKHGQSDNNPYPVFTNKKGVCYGFSNLTKAMMLSQGFPCLVATGYLYGEQAHSWNYAFVDNKWLVIDATNGGWFYMDEYEKYKHLRVQITDVVLFEDNNFAYNYEKGLNIVKIKSTENSISIPYGVNGFIVNAFNPRHPIAENIKKLYISDNITDMGENIFGLSVNDKGLEEIHVKKSNKKYEDYQNVLYRKGQDMPAYIPFMLKKLILRPMKEVRKNTIYNRPNLEEIIFPEGTQKIDAYAVENCPKVTKITVPKNAEIDEKAFFKVNSNLKIVRQ